MTITLLGVAVLTGIYAGCRDMFRAADRFYAAQGLHDIQVMSSYGLTDDDVEALRAVKGVETVQPERSQNVTAKVGGSDKTVTLTEVGVAGLDMPYVQDGRMPSKAGEIAVTKKFLMDSGMKIGDSLTVEPASQSSATNVGDADAENADDGGANVGDADSGTDESSDAAEQAPSFPADLTIVGEVLDPKDLSNPDGIGTAAFRQNIAADYTFFAPSDGVTGNVYTAVSLTISGVGNLSAFSDDYDDAVGEVADRIEHTVLNDRQQSRRQTIVNRAQSKLDQAKKDAYAKLDDAQRTIDDQKKQLADGRQQAKDAKRTLEDQQVELDNNAERLAEGRDQLNAGLTQARNGQSQLQQGLATAQTMSEIAGPAADAAEQSASSAEQAVRDAEQSAVPVSAETLAALRDSATKARDVATQLRAKADDAAAQVSGLNTQLEQVNATIAQLEQQSDELAQQSEQIRQGRQQLRDGLRQIEDSEDQMDDGEAKLKDAQSQLDAKRADADREFATQQQRIDGIANARWYVQTRSAIGGFSAFKSDVSSIESIGRAFPVVFLVVAVLMSLTAMTRMVEEERGLIGTYVGLGYGPALIAMRYVLFAALACLIGGGLGLVAGFIGIPAFLLVVLNGLYSIPDVRLEYDWVTGTGGVALFVVGIVAATLVACVGELRQTPAALMRPKAPKAGTRVLLERIGPLWRRMGFLNKVAVRNIARFKSRLIMTVGGVAGCTALIVCGLAINDSVATIGVKQYEEIARYDLLAVAGEGTGDAGAGADGADGAGSDNAGAAGVSAGSDFDAMRQRIDREGRAETMLELRVESGELDFGGSGETIQLMVVPDGSAGALGEMVSLRDVGGDHGVRALGDDGVIVTQSAANALGVKAGDTVTLRDGSMRTGEAKVADVTRSLIGSEVYVSGGLYQRVFGGASAGASSDTAGSGSGATAGTTSGAASGASAANDGASADTSGSGATPDASDAESTASIAAAIQPNAIMATLGGTADEKIAYADQLGHDPAVVSATSTDHLERDFQFELMSAVVALIVGLAGGLALVVLFTLANANVSERVREMATLKVLGFYDREVHAYVNKEMLALTAAGIVVGLPLGRVVGGMLTAALNMPGMYFEVEVRWTSYVIAAAVTLAFALLVQLLTNPVLDRIDPAVSLKSVE